MKKITINKVWIKTAVKEAAVQLAVCAVISLAAYGIKAVIEKGLSEESESSEE